MLADLPSQHIGTGDSESCPTTGGTRGVSRITNHGKTCFIYARGLDLDNFVRIEVSWLPQKALDDLVGLPPCAFVVLGHKMFECIISSLHGFTERQHTVT